MATKKLRRLPLPDNHWLEINRVKMSVFEEITETLGRLNAKDKKTDEDRLQIKALGLELNTQLINDWSFRETDGLDPKDPKSYSELDFEDRAAVERTLGRYIKDLMDTGN